MMYEHLLVTCLILTRLYSTILLVEGGGACMIRGGVSNLHNHTSWIKHNQNSSCAGLKSSFGCEKSGAAVR